VTHLPKAGAGRRWPVLGLRAVIVVGLLVDAVIHLQLASGYQLAAPAGIGQGTLFRIEAVAAVLTALLVAVRPSRLTYLASVVVAGSALGAVLLYRYVDVPGFGPLPAMYEPIWFAKKAFSAVAEGAALLAAVVALVRSWQSDMRTAPNHR
jgi:hypothetical protein